MWPSAVSKCLFERDCFIDFVSFDILGADSCKFSLLIKESPFIKRDKQSVKQNSTVI